MLLHKLPVALTMLFKILTLTYRAFHAQAWQLMAI